MDNENKSDQIDTASGITRRELIRRALAAGVSISVLGPFLPGAIRRSGAAESSGKFGKLAKDWSGQTLNVSLVAEARSDGLKQLVPEFTDKTGIKVNINIYPYPTFQERQFTAVNQRTSKNISSNRRKPGTSCVRPLKPFMKKRLRAASPA
jgi:hypothetical protein